MLGSLFLVNFLGRSGCGAFLEDAPVPYLTTELSSMDLVCLAFSFWLTFLLRILTFEGRSNVFLS